MVDLPFKNTGAVPFGCIRIFAAPSRRFGCHAQPTPQTAATRGAALTAAGIITNEFDPFDDARWRWIPILDKDLTNSLVGVRIFRLVLRQCLTDLLFWFTVYTLGLGSRA
jgi:hypothetical protein